MGETEVLISARNEYIQIDETNVKNLISDIETPAFGYEKKLIIVINSRSYESIYYKS
mgnify:CR=1 FL=1